MLALNTRALLRPTPNPEEPLNVAERVAASIDALGVGLAAAETLISACNDARLEIKKQHPAEYRAAQRTICKLLAAWMPCRYDDAGTLVRHLPALGCPDLEICTASILIAAFHVAGADGREAEIEGKRLSGKGSMAAPVAVDAEMLSPEQAADQLARDMIGQNPANLGQYEDTLEERLPFARGRFESARVEGRPRDLTLTARKWDELMSEETRVLLKDFFPELRHVRLTIPPGPRESRLVQCLMDTFQGHDDAE